MKAFRNIGTAVILAIGIALTVSWIGELDNSVVTRSGEQMAVFSDHRTRTLTEQSIVDELVELKLSTNIHRVMLGASRLEIDLTVGRAPVKEEEVYSDMATLARLALADSDNIHRVFVRVLVEDDSSRRLSLLLALAGAKDELTDQELQRLRDGEEMTEDWLRKKMLLTETETWRDLTL